MASFLHRRSRQAESRLLPPETPLRRSQIALCFAVADRHRQRPRARANEREHPCGQGIVAASGLDLLETLAKRPGPKEQRFICLTQSMKLGLCAATPLQADDIDPLENCKMAANDS